MPEEIDHRSVEQLPNGETWIEVTVLQRGSPVEGAEISVARSVSGRALRFDLNGETDLNGTARIQIENVARAYCTIRAHASDGQMLGEWNSVPVNKGNLHRLSYDLSP